MSDGRSQADSVEQTGQDGPEPVARAAELPAHIGPWEGHFPNGRAIFYEGTDPKSFVAEMVAKFGFDPSKDNLEWNEADDFRFHCPGDLMDKVYGSGDYQLGS